MAQKRTKMAKNTKNGQKLSIKKKNKLLPLASSQKNFNPRLSTAKKHRAPFISMHNSVQPETCWLQRQRQSALTAGYSCARVDRFLRSEFAMSTGRGHALVKKKKFGGWWVGVMLTGWQVLLGRKTAAQRPRLPRHSAGTKIYMAHMAHMAHQVGVGLTRLTKGVVNISHFACAQKKNFSQKNLISSPRPVGPLKKILDCL